MNGERSLFPERVVRVAGEDVTVRALSFHELMVEVPELVGRVIDKALSIEGEITLSEMVSACSAELYELIKKTTGRGEDFWKRAPASDAMEALAAFAELNLSENFFSCAGRLAQAGRGIGSAWSRLFSPAATAGRMSAGTPSGRSRASSGPSNATPGEGAEPPSSRIPVKRYIAR